MEIRANRWPGTQPEAISDSFRILAVPTGAGLVVVCSKGFVIDTVRIPGMFGLTEIGDVEVDAARSHTLGWNRDEFRRRTIKELRPHILDALKRLKTELSIPARHGFLSSIGKMYGDDVLVDTILPWITVVEPPGFAELLSPQLLAARLESREVFVVYGNKAGPWGSAAFCKEIFPEISDKALIIPVSSSTQPDVGSYEDRDEIIWAPLGEHFGRPYRASDDLERATLLTAVLRIIAMGINKPFEEIIIMKLPRKDRTLCARLNSG